jgi:tetratricopeptide (TPR) repeat protein
MIRLRTYLAFATLCCAGTASADVDGKLNLYEQEARQISQTLPALNNDNQDTGRRLSDAQVTFALGDYDAAALMLFEMAGRPGPEQEAALYYLAESLFHKGDKGAARSYFTQVTTRGNTGARYYGLSLVRLVEIAIAQQDATDVDANLAALERITPRLPQAPYVRGKWLFSQGKNDDAIAQLNEVPKDSAFAAQAEYYIATAHVAKQDTARAIEAYTALSIRKPKSPNDRRVVELAQLALGRLYYERDQPSKAIDSYLLIDRNSDLFVDALYEVAWVYVKGKQFDKALRALELLALSNPNSNRTATVRVLEGNLRIRKAQMNRQAQITNTVEANATDPQVEYDKAAAVFAETHAAYYPSYVALSAMLDSGGDAADYLAQLAERQTQTFQAVAPIPDAAAQYLREEPETQRAVANQVDLGTIQAHLTESENTIARLEAVLSANDKSVVYPAINARRERIGEIQRDLIAIRNDLADQQSGLIQPSGDLAGLQATRKSLAQAWASTPDGEAAHKDKVNTERAGFDALAETTSEIRTAIDGTQAMAVAARKYVTDKPIDGAALVTDDVKTSTKTELVATAGELAAIEAELKELKAEITIGRDLSGHGDDALWAARKQRRDLKAAQDAEHRAIAGFASASRDPGRSKRLVTLGDRAMRISDELQSTEMKIESIVDTALVQAREQLAKERQNVDAYKRELAEYELESRAIGGTILASSFKNVKAKFYDVIVRTDVGAIDVVWSQKEDADDEFKRLNLSRSRELKLITDEFKDILEQTTTTPQGASTPTTMERQNDVPIPKSGSPDKGEGTERVKPGDAVPKATPQPTVRPDNETKPAGGGKK